MDTLVSVKPDALPSIVAIPWSEFKELGAKVPGVKDWTAYTIVRRYYCGAMVMNSLCPQQCALCKPTILFMFTDMQAVKSVRGMLIWRARNAVARKSDNVSQSKAPLSRPEYLQTPEGNPFSQLSIAFS